MYHRRPKRRNGSSLQKKAVPFLVLLLVLVCWILPQYIMLRSDGGDTSINISTENRRDEVTHLDIPAQKSKISLKIKNFGDLNVEFGGIRISEKENKHPFYKNQKHKNSDTEVVGTKVGIIVPYIGTQLPAWFDAFCVSTQVSLLFFLYTSLYDTTEHALADYISREWSVTKPKPHPITQPIFYIHTTQASH